MLFAELVILSKTQTATNRLHSNMLSVCRLSGQLLLLYSYILLCMPDCV